MIEEGQILRLNDFADRAISDDDNLMIWKQTDINPKKSNFGSIKESIKDYTLQNLPSQDNELMPPTSIPDNENYPAEVIGHYATFQGLDVININLQNANGDNYVIPITAEQRANHAHLKLALSLSVVYDGETRITNLESFKDKRLTITLHVAFIENDGDEINENDIVTLTEFVRLNAFNGFPTAENMYQHWNVLRFHYVSNSQINLYANDYYCKDQKTQPSGTDYETQIELSDGNATYVIDDNFSSVGAGIKNTTTLEISYATPTLDENAGTIQLNGSLSNDMTLPLVANEKGFQILDERTQAVYKVPYQGTAIISYLSSTDVWTVVISSSEVVTTSSNGHYHCEHSLPRDFDFAAIENGYITAEVVDEEAGEYRVSGLNQETLFNNLGLSGERFTVEPKSYRPTAESHNLVIDDAYVIANFESVVENGNTYYLIDNWYLSVETSANIPTTIHINVSLDFKTPDGKYSDDRALCYNIINAGNGSLTLDHQFGITKTIPQGCMFWGTEDVGSSSSKYSDWTYGQKVAVLMPISGVLPCGIYQINGVNSGYIADLKLIANYSDISSVSVPQEAREYAIVGDKTFQRVKDTAELTGRGYFKLTSGQKCVAQGFLDLGVDAAKNFSLTNTASNNDVRIIPFYFGDSNYVDRPNFTGCMYRYCNAFVFSNGGVFGLEVEVTLSVSGASAGFGRSNMLYVYADTSSYVPLRSNLFRPGTGMPLIGANSVLSSDGHSSSNLWTGMSASLKSYGKTSILIPSFYVQKFDIVNNIVTPSLASQSAEAVRLLAGSAISISFEPPF